MSDTPSVNESSRSASTASKPAKKLTKKQRRLRAQRKQLIPIAAIVVLVAVVVASVLAYYHWKDNHIETLPQDQRVVAVVNGQETEVAPYSTCEVDDQHCKEGEPFELSMGGAKKFTLKIPQDVYDHDWRLVEIFNDPGANTESYYKSNEKKEVEISLDSPKKTDDGSTPRLTVLEIQSLLIGEDADGEQTPVNAVWSITPTP